MARFSLLLFFLFRIVYSSNAQVEEKPKLYVGGTLGTSVSKLFFFENSNLYKSLPTIGFDGGVMASLKVRKKFRLNAQLIYSQLGRTVKNKGTRPDPLYKVSSRMQYIELPVFYALEFKRLTPQGQLEGGRRKTYNWYVGAGPIVRYWLNDKGTFRSSNLTENLIDHFDYTAAFNSTDATAPGKELMPQANRLQFGVNITAGLAFEPMSGKRIMASVHLNLMQTFLAKSPGSFPTSIPNETNADADELRARNHSIRFSVGYLFDTKIEKRKRGKSTKPFGK
ncbi:MAG: PorT family protein [Bacteroidetes bacterium]|nr:PorT family protein [Bacteroidota bacterium]